jgi:hypothetical protein
VRILLAACLLAIPASAQNAQPAQQAAKNLTSPDGTFRLSYPDILVRCLVQPQKNSWSPQVCMSYFPVCEPVEDQFTTACLAYPRNKYTETQAFGAAALSAAEIKTENEKDCFSGTEDVQPDDAHPMAAIRGVAFMVFKISSAGMNKNFEANLYRTFHAGKCYQLAIATATTNGEVLDPPAREMSKSDWNEVRSRLEQARDSFEFLK